MIDLFVLIFCCTVLAFGIQSRSYRYDSVRWGIKEDWQAKLMYAVLLVSVVLFAGLRTTYNDTATYMQGYPLVDASHISLKTLFESYGGFTLFQQLLKRFISEDPQTLIMASAILINLIFVPFIARHSRNFGASVFLYLIGNFIFGMAGIKQTIAMAFSLFAIENMMKKRYGRSLFWLLIAMTFHPYIICLAALPLLRKRIWSKQTILIILVAVVLIGNLEFLLSYISLFGKDYTMEGFTNNTINPIRVLIEAIPIVIAFIFRRKLNRQENEWLNLGVNMQIIKFAFTVVGLFMNPIYFSRIGAYFTTISVIAIPMMLDCALGEKRDGALYKLGYYGIFAAYFLLDITKLGEYSILYDRFNHISLFSLF